MLAGLAGGRRRARRRDRAARSRGCRRVREVLRRATGAARREGRGDLQLAMTGRGVSMSDRRLSPGRRSSLALRSGCRRAPAARATGTARHGHLRRLGRPRAPQDPSRARRLAARGSLPEEFSVVGVARSPMSERSSASVPLRRRRSGTSAEWEKRVARFSYIAGDDGRSGRRSPVSPSDSVEHDTIAGTPVTGSITSRRSRRSSPVVVRGLGAPGLEHPGKRR